MTLTVYGMKVSTCVRTVLTVIEELGLEYKFVSVSLMTGDQKKPDHMARNPFGKIPALDDDGFVVYESRAICMYLIAKYGKKEPRLMPEQSDFKAFAKFCQGASIETSYYKDPASTIAYEIVFKSWSGKTSDPELVKVQKEKLAGVLDVYEKILESQKFMGGDSFTVVDIFHLPYGHLVTTQCGLSELFDSRPNVKRWWNEISSRSSWKKVSSEAEA